MEQLEISARTVEEATRLALERLGVTREQVEVTVLNEGRSGILGIGAEEARIRVTVLGENTPEETEPEQYEEEEAFQEGNQQPIDEETANRATDILEELLQKMDIPASVEVSRSRFLTEAGMDASPVFLQIQGEDLGILIGRHGQTLASLQYIVRLMLAHRDNTWVPVVIDVEGYKERRYESLQALAQRTAEQVASRRIPIALRPMPPYERRIVHLALAKHPQVVTESSGIGGLRKVVIQPKPR